MLLEIAIGDAYGAGFEFAPQEFVEKNNTMKRYLPHAMGSLQAGQYTDDTQMSLAIAELILDDVAWTHKRVADKFVEVFHRDPRKGYAKGFQALLESVDTGSELIDKIRPNSFRNGAAMRSVPLGVFEDVDELLNKARIQAEVTHNTPMGILSSQAVAIASHVWFHKNGCIQHCYDLLIQHLGLQFNLNWKGRVECDAYQTVCAVLTELHLGHKNRKELLQKCVSFGGDTDSVAAITNGISGDTFDHEVDSFLYQDLENGKYGRDYLEEIDDVLYKKFK